MAKKKQKSALGYICLALVAICAILAVVGVFLNWVGIETILDDVFDDSEQKGFTLGDFDTMAEEYGLELELIQGVRAVGYLAVAAICVVLVAYVVKQLFSFGLFRIIVILGGVATMAIGVAAIAYTASQTAQHRWSVWRTTCVKTRNTPQRTSGRSRKSRTACSLNNIKQIIATAT